MNTSIIEAISLTMSSLEIAKLTGKRHDNVLRDIDDIVKSLNLNQNSGLSYGFKSSTYNTNGRSYRCYELDKDSTLCLLAGYDAVARMKIVKRWQHLEDQGRQPALAPQIRRYFDHKRTVPDHHFIALEVVALELIVPLHDSGLDILKEMMPESSFVRSWNKELRQAGEVIESFESHEIQTDKGIWVHERCYPDRLFISGRNHFWSTWLPVKCPQYFKYRQCEVLQVIPKAYPRLQGKLNNHAPMFPSQRGQKNLFN